MNPSFVELWVYLSATPLFGLTATLGVYLLAQVFYQRMGQAPWANPVLWSVFVIASVLVATRVPYPTYFSGAQFIHFLLGPAVVALGWPLWQRRGELRRRWRRVLAAALVGGAAASVSAVALGWAVGLPRNVVLSLVPKSVTVPVAMGIAEKIGGVPELAAAFTVVTGLAGALLGRYLLDAVRIAPNPAGAAARGFAMGTAAHGLGAARAMQVNADAGAWAGLALGLQAILASLLMPLIFRLLP